MSAEASDTSPTVYFDDLDPEKPVGATDSIYEAGEHARLLKRTARNTLPYVTAPVPLTHHEFNSVVGSHGLAGFHKRLANQNILLNGDFLRTYYMSSSTPSNGGQVGAPCWRFLRENTATTRISVSPYAIVGAGEQPRSVRTAFKFSHTVSMALPGTELHSIYQRLPERALRATAGRVLTLTLYAYASFGWTCSPKLVQVFGTGGVPSGSVEISADAAAAAFTTGSWQRRSWSFTLPAVSGKTFGSTPNTAYLEIRAPVHAAGVMFYGAYSYLTGLRLHYGDVDWEAADYEEEDLGAARAAESAVELFVPAYSMPVAFETATAYRHPPILFPGRFHKVPTCTKIYPNWAGPWGAACSPNVTAAVVDYDMALVGGTASSAYITAGCLGNISTPSAGFLFSAFPGER